MSGKYTKVGYLTDIIDLTMCGVKRGFYSVDQGFFNDAGLVRRDFYIDIGNGRKDYILASKQFEAFDLNKLGNLQQRIEQGKVYVKNKIKRSEVISKEEIDALLYSGQEEPRSSIGPYPNAFRKKIKFSKNDSTIRVSRQFMRDMEDPENSRAFMEGRLDDIKHTWKGRK